MQFLDIAVDIPAPLIYSLLHAQEPVYTWITLGPTPDVPCPALTLQLVVPGYAESVPLDLPPRTLPARPETMLCPVRFRLLNEDRWAALQTATRMAMLVQVNGEPVQPHSVIEVRVLPPNALYTLSFGQQALAGFVMRHSSAVPYICQQARPHLRRLAAGAESFPAVDLETRVHALYEGLQACSLIYGYEPTTYEEDWQAVRWHHEVLDRQEGTCIDLVVLFAACLEALGDSPVIIIDQTTEESQHALLGCWRGRPCLPDALLSEHEVWDGVQTGALLVLDPRGWARTHHSAQWTFQQCQGQAVASLHRMCRGYAVDITAARMAKIEAMPFGEPLGLYTRLEKLLAAGQWQAADEETLQVMCTVVGKTPSSLVGRALTAPELARFPGRHLQRLDDLWGQYSHHRFGFRIQWRLFQAVGGDLLAFAQRIGWYKDERWIFYSDVQFDLSAPEGHLPVGGAQGLLLMEWEKTLRHEPHPAYALRTASSRQALQHELAFWAEAFRKQEAQLQRLLTKWIDYLDFIHELAERVEALKRALTTSSRPLRWWETVAFIHTLVRWIEDLRQRMLARGLEQLDFIHELAEGVETLKRALTASSRPLTGWLLPRPTPGRTPLASLATGNYHFVDYANELDRAVMTLTRKAVVTLLSQIWDDGPGEPWREDDVTRFFKAARREVLTALTEEGHRLALHWAIGRVALLKSHAEALTESPLEG